MLNYNVQLFSGHLAWQLSLAQKMFSHWHDNSKLWHDWKLIEINCLHFYRQSNSSADDIILRRHEPQTNMCAILPRNKLCNNTLWLSILDVFTGTRPLVNHHYRRNRVALWTELIPKLHQSSDDEEDDDFIVDPAAAGSGSSGSNESRGVSHVSVAASSMFVYMMTANRWHCYLTYYKPMLMRNDSGIVCSRYNNTLMLMILWTS